ncbi:hypothetical protein ACFLTD_02560 [Elusimicrobiota bacterium]
MRGAPVMSGVFKIVDIKAGYTSRKIKNNLKRIFADPLAQKDNRYEKVSINKNELELVKDYLERFESENRTYRDIIDLMKSYDDLKHYKTLAVYLTADDPRIEQEVKRQLINRTISMGDTKWNTLVKHLLSRDSRMRFRYLDRSWIIIKLLALWNMKVPHEDDKEIIESLLKHPDPGVRKALIAGVSSETRFNMVPSKKMPLWKLISAVPLIGVLIVSIVLDIKFFKSYTKHQVMQQELVRQTLSHYISGYDSMTFRDKDIRTVVIPILKKYENWRDIPYQVLKYIVSILRASEDDNAVHFLEALLVNVPKMTGDRNTIEVLLLDALESKNKAGIEIYGKYIMKNINTDDKFDSFIHVIDSLKNIYVENSSSSHKDKAFEYMMKTAKYKDERIARYAVEAVSELAAKYNIAPVFNKTIAAYAGDPDFLQMLSRLMAARKDVNLAQLQAEIFFIIQDEPFMQETIIGFYLDKNTPEDVLVEILSVLFSGTSRVSMKGALSIKNIKVVNMHPVPGILKFISGLENMKKVELIGNFLLSDSKFVRDQAMDYLQTYGDEGIRVILDIISADDENKELITFKYDNSTRGIANTNYSWRLTERIVDFIGTAAGDIENRPLLDRDDVVRVLKYFKESHAAAALKAAKLLHRMSEYKAVSEFIVHINPQTQLEVIEILKDSRYGSRTRNALAVTILEDRKIREVEGIDRNFVFTGNIFADERVARSFILYLAEADLREQTDIKDALLAVVQIPGGLSKELTDTLVTVFEQYGLIKEIAYLLINEDPQGQYEVLEYLIEKGDFTKEYLLDVIIELSQIVVKHEGIPDRLKSYKRLRDELGLKILGFIEDAGNWNPKDFKTVGIMGTSYNKKLNAEVKKLLIKMMGAVSGQTAIDGMKILAGIKFVAEHPQSSENNRLMDAVSYFLLCDKPQVQDETVKSIIERSFGSKSQDPLLDSMRSISKIITGDFGLNRAASPVYMYLRDNLGMDILSIYREYLDRNGAVGFLLDDYTSLSLYADSPVTEIGDAAESMLRELVFTERLDVRQMSILSDISHMLFDQGWLEGEYIRIVRYLKMSPDDDVRKKADELMKDINTGPRAILASAGRSFKTAAALLGILGFATNAHAGDLIADIFGGITVGSVAGSAWFAAGTMLLLALGIWGVMRGSGLLNAVLIIVDKKLGLTSSKIKDNLDRIFAGLSQDKNTNTGLPQPDSDNIRLVGDILGRFKTDNKSAKDIAGLIQSSDELKYFKVLAVYLSLDDADITSEVKTQLVNRGISKTDTNWNEIIRFLLSKDKRSALKYLNRSWIIMKLLDIWNVAEPSDADKQVLTSLMKHPDRGVRKTAAVKVPGITGTVPGMSWLRVSLAGILIVGLAGTIGLNIRVLKSRFTRTLMQAGVNENRLRHYIPAYDVIRWKDYRIIDRVIPLFHSNIREVPFKQIEIAVDILKGSFDEGAVVILKVFLDNAYKMKNPVQTEKIVIDALEYKDALSLEVFEYYLNKNIKEDGSVSAFIRSIGALKNIFINNYSSLNGEKAFQIMFNSMRHKNHDVRKHVLDTIKDISEKVPVSDIFRRTLLGYYGDWQVLKEAGKFLAMQDDEESARVQVIILFMLNNRPDDQKEIFKIYFDRYDPLDENVSLQVVNSLKMLFSGDYQIGLSAAYSKVNVKAVSPEMIPYILDFISALEDEQALELMVNLLLVDDEKASLKVMAYLENYEDKAWIPVMDIVERNKGAFIKYYTGLGEYYANDSYSKKVTERIVRFIGSAGKKLNGKSREFRDYLVKMLTFFSRSHSGAAMAALDLLHVLGEHESVVRFVVHPDIRVKSHALQMLKDEKYADKGRQALADMIIEDEKLRIVEYRKLKFVFIEEMFKNVLFGKAVLEYLAGTDMTEGSDVHRAMMILPCIPGGLNAAETSIILKAVEKYGSMEDLAFMLINENKFGQKKALELILSKGTAAKDELSRMIIELSAMKNVRKKSIRGVSSEKDDERLPAYDRLRDEYAHMVLDYYEQTGNWNAQDIKAVALIATGDNNSVNGRVKSIISGIMDTIDKGTVKDAITLLSRINVVVDIPELSEARKIADIISYFLLSKKDDIQEHALREFILWSFEDKTLKGIEIFKSSLASRIFKDLEQGREYSEVYLKLRDSLGSQVLKIYEEIIRRDRGNHIELDDFRILMLFRDKKAPVEVRKTAQQIFDSVLNDKTLGYHHMSVLKNISNRADSSEDLDPEYRQILEYFTGNVSKEVAETARELKRDLGYGEVIYLNSIPGSRDGYKADLYKPIRDKFLADNKKNLRKVTGILKGEDGFSAEVILAFLSSAAFGMILGSLIAGMAVFLGVAALIDGFREISGNHISEIKLNEVFSQALKLEEESEYEEAIKEYRGLLQAETPEDVVCIIEEKISELSILNEKQKISENSYNGGVTDLLYKGFILKDKKVAQSLLDNGIAQYNKEDEQISILPREARMTEIPDNIKELISPFEYFEENSMYEKLGYKKLVNVLDIISRNKEIVKQAAIDTGIDMSKLSGVIRDNLESVSVMDDDKVRELVRVEWDKYFDRMDSPLQMQLYLKELSDKLGAESLLRVSFAETVLMIIIAGAANPLWVQKLITMQKEKRSILSDLTSLVRLQRPEIFSENTIEDRIQNLIKQDRDTLLNMVTAADTGKIELAAETSIDEAGDIVFVGIDTAEKLVKLYKESPRHAIHALTALVKYERTRIDDEKEHMKRFAEAMQKTLGIGSKDLAALVLWYELYDRGMAEDKKSITRYAGAILKGHELPDIRDINHRVHDLNDMYLEGQKRIIAAQDRGMTGVDKAKKYLKAAARLAVRFSLIVKNLFNVTTSAPTIPSALLKSAFEDGSFARLSAYALGERKAKSLLDVLMEIAREIDAAARGEQEGSIFDDMRDVRELIQAT